MINYKPVKFKELNGPYKATVTNACLEKNNFFDPKNENSTEENLTLEFQLDDPETGEVLEYTQKFISPLTGGRMLFQQLMDIQGVIPDMDGGQYDERTLIGLNLTVVMGKNKKGYNTIESVMAADPDNGKIPTPTEQTPLSPEVDLPF